MSFSPSLSATALRTVPLDTWRSRFPGKSVYLLCAYTRLITLDIPYWFFKYFILRVRPNLRWTPFQTLVTAAANQLILINSASARMQPSPYTEIPAAAKMRNTHFVWIPAADKLYMRYGAASTVNRNGQRSEPSERLPAFWYVPKDRMQAIQANGRGSLHSPALQGRHGKTGVNAPKGVGLLFHGGGYVACTAGEGDFHAPAIKLLVSKTNLDILALEYRLAPAAAYPAQLQDAITAYLYVTNTLGIPGSRVVLCGDSAGGNLVLALLRWIAEARASGAPNVQNAGAAILISPWVDLGQTLSAAASRRTMDTFPTELGLFGKTALLRGHDIAKMVVDPGVSPFYDTPERLAEILPPNTYVSIGGGEVLREEVEIFVANARAGRAEKAGDRDLLQQRVRGKKGKVYLGQNVDGYVDEQYGIVWDVVEDCVHDYMVVPVFRNETKRLFERVALWLDDVLVPGL